MVEFRHHRRWLVAVGAGLVLLCLGGTRASSRPPVDEEPPYPVDADAWATTGLKAVRGVTIGPIENQLHRGHGYGSPACANTMTYLKELGANWVSLTVFGRVWDLRPSGVASRFEAPYRANQRSVAAAVDQAHAAGLRVLLVPHLWVESGDWRGLIDPGSDEDWRGFAESYEDFVDGWAKVAARAGVDMMAIGVELRSWATGNRAPLLLGIIERLRKLYPGPLTYAANWDDVHDTVLWSSLDVIGINAFFPLADKPDASDDQLLARAEKISVEVGQLAARWKRPVLFTEFGYTTRKDPSVRPWEWPEDLGNVTVDQVDQARAYRALLTPFIKKPWFVGVFVWRVYADLEDTSQEPEWGFSPSGKLAERELREAFAAHWGADGRRFIGDSLGRWTVYGRGD